jgi:hypothetical protein
MIIRTLITADNLFSSNSTTLKIIKVDFYVLASHGFISLPSMLILAVHPIQNANKEKKAKYY